MSIITRMRKQKACWWPQLLKSDNTPLYDDFGQPQHGAPTEIKCRWEDVAAEFIAKDGTTAVSSSVVYVDRIVRVGDLLRLGDLTTITNPQAGTLFAKSNGDVGEIRQFNKLPNIRNTETLLTAYL